MRWTGVQKAHYYLKSVKAAVGVALATAGPLGNCRDEQSLQDLRSWRKIVASILSGFAVGAYWLVERWDCGIAFLRVYPTNGLSTSEGPQLITNN